MSMSRENAQWFQGTFEQMVANIEQEVLGKTHVVRLAVTALLSRGHLLLEDVPGTGKTSLAKAIAATVHGTSSRIQFTPDLLPSDVTGSQEMDPNTRTFVFRRGPIFASIVLADEINRASPKTQSALLEVMEEGTVTVDGETHRVGPAFMVIATQNPVEHAGTYRLPEAQLDRFIMKTSLGYPDHGTTVRILGGAALTQRGAEVAPIIATNAVSDMATMATTVHVDPALLEYISLLVTRTRDDDKVQLGVSVRGALALVRVARTWAAAAGRNYVVPDDIKAIAEPVLAHRMMLDPEAEFDGARPGDVIARALEDVPPPAERLSA